MPRIRGRMYSSWASSTWSFPSALTACWAKMSRMSSVRSTTRDFELVLEQPLLRRSELVVDEQHLGAGVVVEPASALRAFPCRRTCAGRASPCWTRRADRLDAGRARELIELGQLVVGVDALREHGQDEPALGLEARRGIGLTWRHRQSL